ncbi:MAG: ubiquinone/menaquinone biosynthesis methyltransferase [Elusimicrobia bacterium]|nr:ubiquinone/menaquinone biosynthesis methyltransferase [Elusimicrobiota bacterium]
MSPDVQALFNQLAPRYDRFNRLASLGLDRWWRRVTIQRIPPHDAGALLDVATGTGELAILAARERPCLTRIEGLDFSPQMLAFAREKASRVGLKDRIQLTEGWAEALPYPDGTFTWLTNAFAMRHVCSRLRQVLGEMARVLTPGGQVLILEFSRPTWMMARAIHGAYVRFALPRLGHWLTGETIPFHYLRDSIQGFLDPLAFLTTLREAGFSAVQATPLTWGTVILYQGRKT